MMVGDPFNLVAVHVAYFGDAVIGVQNQIFANPILLLRCIGGEGTEQGTLVAHF